MEEEVKKAEADERNYNINNNKYKYKYRVGYAMEAGKVESVIKPSLVSNCESKAGINLVPIDPNRSLTEQHEECRLDCIVHKLYDDEGWCRNLTDFSDKHPDVPIVDHPLSILPLRNRSSMLLVLLLNPSYYYYTNHHHHNISIGIRVGVPRQVAVYDDDNDKGSSNGVLKYPLIAKPLLVNGKDDSHVMSLLYDSSGTIGLKTPVVLQEFVNHGGVIFKVYVAGKHIECVKRRSLPDISEDELKTLSGKLPFSQISNLTAPQYKKDNEDVVTQTTIDNTVMPPLDFVHDLANGMRERLGLNLFNFDMIRETTDENSYLVIDINYFPGYAKIPSYETMLTNFFLDIVTKEVM